jgi:hypothetical protein
VDPLEQRPRVRGEDRAALARREGGLRALGSGRRARVERRVGRRLRLPEQARGLFDRSAPAGVDARAARGLARRDRDPRAHAEQDRKEHGAGQAQREPPGASLVFRARPGLRGRDLGAAQALLERREVPRDRGGDAARTDLPVGG